MSWSSSVIDLAGRAKICTAGRWLLAIDLSCWPRLGLSWLVKRRGGK